VGTLRAAVLTWSVGATQLDAVSVERDLGHLHVYLPGVAGSGAITADEAEEGGLAHDHAGDDAHAHDHEGDDAHDEETAP
jgi:hypothetical protein